MIWIILSVRKTVRKSLSHSFERRSTKSTATQEFSSSLAFNNNQSNPNQKSSSWIIRRTNSTSSQLELNLLARTRRVAWMAVLYTIPFYITILMMEIRISQDWDRKLILVYMMNIYLAVAMPLQGFINWLVYIRPKIVGQCCSRQPRTMAEKEHEQEEEAKIDDEEQQSRSLSSTVNRHGEETAEPVSLKEQGDDACRI
ncbi:MAG: hypothetical protein SGARI_003970 [Bacillariaceae sp.]